MKRGEVYFISIPHSTGHEMMKDRPGVIVSCTDRGPQPVVTVVLCSTSANRDIRNHVTLRTLRKMTVAMCERVYTVDCSRLGTYLGEITASELQSIDIGLLSHLGLDLFTPTPRNTLVAVEPETEEPEPEEVDEPAEEPACCDAVAAELAVYKTLYNDLLTRMLGGVR